MSGRGGGRGGGGRGRGRGGPLTGARAFMQRSAQEAGLDAGNLRNLHDITRPKLFPDFEWHSSGRRGHDEISESAASSASVARNKASTVYLINKSREIHHRFQNSPFYVRPKQEVDVVRYGKRPRPMEPDIFVLQHIGKAADARYMPSELLQDVRTQKSMKELDEMDEEDFKKEMTLEDMARKELKRREQAADAEDGDEGDHSDTLEQEDDEEEEVEDYIVNHYESEGESDGGDDEPTF